MSNSKLVNPLNKMIHCLYFHPSVRAPHGQNGIRIHFIYQIVLLKVKLWTDNEKTSENSEVCGWRKQHRHQRGKKSRKSDQE